METAAQSGAEARPMVKTVSSPSQTPQERFVRRQLLNPAWEDRTSDQEQCSSPSRLSKKAVAEMAAQSGTDVRTSVRAMTSPSRQHQESSSRVRLSPGAKSGQWSDNDLPLQEQLQRKPVADNPALSSTSGSRTCPSPSQTAPRK